MGSPSIPAVKEGQRVNIMDIVADVPRGALGAKVHSSISGIVSGISKDFIEVEG